MRADDGVRADDLGFLKDAGEGGAARFAVAVADHGELGGLPLVIGDLPDVEDARPHHLRDRLAAGVPGEEKLT